MKKTVTRPDGTTEVLEGTPEEIAAHEKLVREETKKKEKKPDVLKGKEQSELMQWLEELQKRTKEIPSVPQWPQPAPIWVTPTCAKCYTSPCVCHWIDLSPTIICQSVSDNKITITKTESDERSITAGHLTFTGYDGPGMH
jgi:hypothetical protein